MPLVYLRRAGLRCPRLTVTCPRERFYLSMTQLAFLEGENLFGLQGRRFFAWRELACRRTPRARHVFYAILLVHCMTNDVVQTFTANILLAVAIPGDPPASLLAINVSDRQRRRCLRRHSAAGGKPWRGPVARYGFLPGAAGAAACRRSRYAPAWPWPE